MAEWPTLALFWYAPHITGGIVDPIFGKPLNFFLFTLPAWQVLLGWLLTLSIITCALAIFFLLIAGGARMLAGRLSRQVLLPWRSFSITFGFLLLILAMRMHISAASSDCSRITRSSPASPTPTRTSRSPACSSSRRARSGRAARVRQRGAAPREALARCRRRSRRGLLCRPSGGRLVRQQLHRQAERTGSRDAVHRPQHRDDAAGLRLGRGHAARVPGRDHGRGGRPGEQSGDAAEHPAVGLARAAGHAASDSGNPHLLRLPRHRHRSLRDRRDRCAR